MPSKWLFGQAALVAATVIAACGNPSGTNPNRSERSTTTAEALSQPAGDRGANACSLLDTPSALATMSAAFETKLSLECGRVDRLPVVPDRGVSPALRQALGSSNIIVNNPAQDTGGHTTHSETSTVAVGSVICTAFNDAGEGFGANGFSGFAFSLDGGQSFTDGGAFPNGAADSNDGDPSLAYSARDATFYYAALSTKGISLWRSTTSCQSFQYVGPIHTGGADDKEFIAVDNTVTSPHYGRLYLGWTNFSLGTDHNQAQFSDDGGATWSMPASLPGSGANGQGMWPAVAPNGDVYFALLNGAGTVGGLQDQFIFKSIDGGSTWSKMTNIGSAQLRPENPAATSTCGREALTANIRYLPSPQIVITPDATASAGYVVHGIYSYDSDGTGPDMSNVFYRRSTDGAQTWSAEVQLNDDKTTTDQFFPTIGVSETGVLVASWYDRRLDTTNDTQFDRFIAFSVDHGNSWSANARVSDVSSPVAQTAPNFDGLAECYHGDYDQMAVAGSIAHVVWSDDRRTLSTGPNPDVYYNKVVIGPAVTVSPSVFEGGNKSNGTVFLAAAAGSDSTVTLASSAPAVVSVPASVVVPAGSQSAPFSVSSVSTLTQTPVTLTATFPDATTAAANLVVLASPTASSLTLSPTSVTGGQTSTGTVTLSGPAPAGGSVVALSAAPSTVATVPSSVTVAAGATTTTFAVSTSTQSADTSASVTASLNGVARTATLQVTAPAGNASFDATLKVPRCASPGNVCDSGPTLVRGRDNMSGGPEQNSPNALGGTCLDGTAGTFHVDESIDRVMVSTVDGTALAPGKQVNVDVTVWEFNQSDVLDVFFAPDATNPVWAFEGSVAATLSQALGVVRVSFTLPSAAAGSTTLPAIRAQWRFGGTLSDAGSPSTCTGGTFDDRDDLVFTYQVDTTPPTAAVTSPASGANVHGVISVAGTASDDTGIAQVILLIDGSELPFSRPLATGAARSSVVTTSFSLPLDTTTLTAGSHLIAAEATDLAGNVGDSAPVTILVDNTPPTVAITAPSAGAQVSGSVTVTATASDVGSGVASVAVLVDGAVVGTATAAPYSVVWNAAQASPGAHTLTARATDVAGNQTISAAVAVTVVGPPVVSAGANQTITLPATATLNGSVTPSTSTVAWTKTSGPGTVTFSAPTSVTTAATFSAAGTYVVRLTATSAGLSAFAEATITVNPAATPPVVSAGANQTITLPATATLNGSVTPSTSTVAWTRTSGPGTVTFSAPASVTTAATFSAAGTYVVRLTATSAGLSAFAEATITVNPAVGNTPCSGLCSNPVNVTINGSFQSGNLGTGAVCAQTTSPIHGGNCGNFVSPRTLSVNGTQETCNSGNWSSVPATRNGGYCIQTTTGNQPWAFYTLW